MSGLSDARSMLSRGVPRLVILDPSPPLGIPTLDISESRHGKCLRLVVSGEVDLGTVSEFRAALFSASNSAIGALIVDIRGVTFLGVSGLSCLVDLVRGNMLTALAIVANTHATRRSIEIIGQDPDLVVFSRLGDALHYVDVRT
ncbi:MULTISPECIES: STAS domain-containing protein [unclassified Rhodococcus (in: high G+C Gram-positive bacteria)]|uniref:STAS domain-containing protein n=1 Tax=unclassified Rhodococcus (in: high G+C Gram-positive bacteria) TaxID=192944 RepID=UPI0015C49F39|nr:STAS domain-containing protein [Rhodococcus sp. 1163]